jgi:pullulanase/glycogen debranching enzyme
MQLAPDTTAVGTTQNTDTLLCLINRDEIPVSFLLPGEVVWWQVFDSSAQAPFEHFEREKTSPVPARSVQILSRQEGRLSDA